jgi:hypothetical protein
MSKFEDNGGYYIDGVRYMDCKYTGIPVKTLPPTKVKAKKKTKRRTKDEILVARHKEKLAAERQLKKDLDKQKKFLMGDVEK